MLRDWATIFMALVVALLALIYLTLLGHRRDARHMWQEFRDGIPETA